MTFLPFGSLQYALLNFEVTAPIVPDTWGLAPLKEGDIISIDPGFVAEERCRVGGVIPQPESGTVLVGIERGPFAQTHAPGAKVSVLRRATVMGFDDELGPMVSIPMPLWVRTWRTWLRYRPSCCRIVFKTEVEYEQHWLREHHA